MERWLETVDREAVDRVVVVREGGVTGVETLARLL